MGAIRFQYLPLDDKGGKGTSKSATGDEDADSFDFVSGIGESDEADMTNLLLRDDSTTANGYELKNVTVDYFSTGGSGGYDQVNPDDTMIFHDDLIG